MQQTRAELLAEIERLTALLPAAKKRTREPGAAKKQAPRTVSADELTRILAVIDLRKPSGLRNRALLLLLVSSGMRVGEALYSRRDAYKGTEHEWSVPAEGKSGERTIALPRGANGDSLDAALVAWAGVRDSAQEGTERVSPFYFCPLWGGNERIFTQSIERMLTDYARKVGIERRLTPHMLRHTAASAWLKTWDVPAVSKQLGHSSPRVTMQVYAHSDMKHLHEQQERDARERAGDGPIPF